MGLWQILKEILTLPSNHISIPSLWLFLLLFIYHNYSFDSLKNELMAERAEEGENMHYLLIIKITCRINKPEQKATFVSSKARFPAFCYPRAWMFGVPCRVFLLGLTLHPRGLTRYWGGGGWWRGVEVMPWHIHVSVWGKETSQPHAGSSRNSLLLISLCDPKW